MKKKLITFLSITTFCNFVNASGLNISSKEEIYNNSRCYIDDNSIKSNIYNIGGIQDIKFLDLSDNFIGDEGAREISSAFKNDELFRNLKAINLSGNKIGEEGILSLAHILKYRPELEYIAVFKNPGASINLLQKEIEGLEKIIWVLPSNSVLKYAEEMGALSDENMKKHKEYKNLKKMVKALNNTKGNTYPLNKL